jgi:MoaA/NifB/PqqE/SkfB family radical SAM enzyme
LVLFVTARCNLLCRHCFYHRELNQNRAELTVEEIQAIARSLPNLLNVSLTGGEPYLRADLPDIAEAFERYSDARNLQIPSNGLVVRQILTRTEEILKRVRRARVCTGVSLDGPPDIHNRLRQNPRSYDCAVETLKGLKALKKIYSNLSVGVGLTMSAANQDALGAFFDRVAEELRPDAVTVTLIRGDPLDPSLRVLDTKAYRGLVERVIAFSRSRNHGEGWLERLATAKEEEVYRLTAATAESKERVASCYAGELLAVVSETGEVYPCELLDRSMGNVRDFSCDLARLWNSLPAADVRRFRNEIGCQCTYECAASVNTLFNPSRLLRILVRTVSPGR